MSTISECLTQMQKLTQTNLDILNAVNGALRGDSTSTKVEINGKKYDIPSFVSLENKVNNLQETLNNIVNAPATGEAFITMNGNSRVIEMRGYTSTPNSLSLETTNEFGIESNNIFKDFLTPIPYLSFSLDEIPNDITSVNIKKIIPKTDKMVEYFQQLVGTQATTPVSYANILGQIKTNKLTKNVDYIEYDTVKKLPIRKCIGNGEYIIQTVVDDYIDENLDNYIIVKLATVYVPTGQENTMTFVRFDGTIETYLAVGDQLVTYDDGAKLEIVEVDYNNLQMKLKVLHGEYLNLIGVDSYDISDGELYYDNVSNISKLKFYSPVDLSLDKTINVPLEEDDFVFIAIAPLNDRLNIQSPWGTGVAVNTNYLQRTITDGDNQTIQSFKSYYANSVKNIGDCLNEITSMMSGELTKFSKLEFARLVTLQPSSDLIVVTPIQINKHLNNSPAIENIKKLYSQKTKYQQELDDVQLKIDECNRQLSSISITDTTGIRSVYNNQLKEYNNKYNEISTSITNVIDQLSIIASDSSIPVDSAKFHVRGYFDIKKFDTYLKDNGFNQVAGKIRGVEVQYRYVNENAEEILNANTNAVSIDGNFLYSEWNVMPITYHDKVVEYNYGYVFNFEADNNIKNEPSFNQIDIPITQGEKVELKLRVIYDYGYPYVKVSSPWSEIVTVNYPLPAKTEIQVKTIISENNNDIETNRFKNLLDNNGVMNHVGDEVKDQDITYLHKPDNIASGFYTAERRVIPLREKLQEMSNMIAQLNDEINGSNNTKLKVTMNIGNTENILAPNSVNNIYVESYSTFDDENYINTSNGAYDITEDVETGEIIVSALLNLTLTNESSHSTKLYPMFPGGVGDNLDKLKNYKYTLSDFISDTPADGKYKGVWLAHNDSNGNIQLIPQQCNQFLTFRIKNIWNGENYYNDTVNRKVGEVTRIYKYGDGEDNFKNDFMPLSFEHYKYSPTFESHVLTGPSLSEKGVSKDFKGSIIYPFLPDKGMLLTSNTDNFSYYMLGPNESIVIPIIFEYKLDQDGYNSTSKIMSFDIRTSLYRDPVSYAFKVNAKYYNKTQDNLLLSNKNNQLKYKTLSI